MSSKAKQKICPYPFARMEVRANRFVPCCPTWLTEEYHALEPGEDLWNGPAAQELRQRIYKGDYSLCRRELCGVPITTIDDNEEHEAQVHIENIAAIESQNPKLPASPTSLSIVADPRCNLACPSCREGHILSLSEGDQRDMHATDDSLKQHAAYLESITFGDGEVLFSPWMRGILQSLLPDKYPRLRCIEIKTNGLLFDEKNYLTLLPGSQFIRRVSVSVDAGDEATYSRVRGGDWNRLVKNLQWMSSMRKSKKIESLQINFTVRKDNYRSLESFVELGESLDVDSIKITSFEKWERMAVDDYYEQAVHLPQHPEHQDLYAIWNKIQGRNKVRWSLLLPQLQRAELNL